jgi:hypothetical protein
MPSPSGVIVEPSRLHPVSLVRFVKEEPIAALPISLQTKIKDCGLFPTGCAVPAGTYGAEYQGWNGKGLGRASYPLTLGLLVVNLS